MISQKVCRLELPWDRLDDSTRRAFIGSRCPGRCHTIRFETLLPHAARGLIPSVFVSRIFSQQAAVPQPARCARHHRIIDCRPLKFQSSASRIRNPRPAEACFSKISIWEGKNASVRAFAGYSIAAEHPGIRTTLPYASLKILPKVQYLCNTFARPALTASCICESLCFNLSCRVLSPRSRPRL